MVNTIKVLHKQAVKSESDWIASNPVIPDGVMAFSSENGQYKLGNGVSTWNELTYCGDDEVSDEQILSLFE